MTSLVGSDQSDGLEVDQNEDVDDSALGSDVESAGSASLTSSIVGYKYENGRRCMCNTRKEVPLLVKAVHTCEAKTAADLVSRAKTTLIEKVHTTYPTTNQNKRG